MDHTLIKKGMQETYSVRRIFRRNNGKPRINIQATSKRKWEHYADKILFKLKN